MLLDFWQHYIYRLLDSTFFLSVTTIGVAGAAYFVYVRAKRDFKQDAANTILMEIESAEELIKEAKRTLAQAQAQTPPLRKFPEKTPVMKSDSWSKYRYLFARDLPANYISDVDDFYFNCRLFDESVAHIDSAFMRNETEVRVQSFRILADAMEDYINSLTPNQANDPKVQKQNDERTQEYVKFQQAFTDAFPTTFGYSPSKPYQDAEYYLDQLPINLSKTDVGTEIKRLAGNTASTKKKSKGKSKSK